MGSLSFFLHKTSLQAQDVVLMFIKPYKSWVPLDAETAIFVSIEVCLKNIKFVWKFLGHVLSANFQSS